MIVDEKKALERLNSEDNLANKLEAIKSGVSIKRLPQSDGPRSIPPKMQELIGVTAKLTSGAKAAEVFGVSQPMASMYARGGTKATEHSVPSRIASAHEMALDAMLAGISRVKDKLNDPKCNIKATDAAKIAADMGRVIEKTSPKEAARTNVLVVAYAPRMKSESEFEEVTI